MGYRVVDMSADPRCGQFAYFRRMTFPFAGITAEVDITDLMAARNGRPFFLSMLYAVTRAVNAVPQLRRRITEDGAVVEYDWCAPSYTAMKPDGVYVYCTVEGDLPYDEFVRLGQSRQREVLERGTLTEDGDIRGMIFVSSVPWLHYTQLQHPAESPDDSNPRISWGKYVTANGRTTLPVSLFVNHALADGLTVYGVENAPQLLRHLRGEERLAPAQRWEPTVEADSVPDFADVMGQENVKRALEIAAAGSHNVLLIGSPGAGKSMLARRLPSILPDMTHEEALESTEIWSVAGLTDSKHPMLTQRPFRSPHHTLSAAAMSGILLANGWTGKTAVCVIVFTLMHWPCSTTLLSIKKETGSRTWTALAAVLPTLCGALLCMLINLVFH